MKGAIYVLVRRGFLVLPLVLCGLVGCSTELKGTCEDHNDCRGGDVCVDGACYVLCKIQSECPGDLICGTNDTCVVGKDGAPPSISDIKGNAGGDGSTIENGLVVTGDHLDNTRFELRGDGDPTSLTVTAATPTEAQLQLPRDIHSGAYTLVAVNLAGEDQQGITLTLPELDADEIVRRLNDEATTSLDVSVLPVGTTSSDVASGDHAHDGRYYGKPEVYTKSEVDTEISHTKSEINLLLNGHSHNDLYYGKTDVYTQTEVDTYFEPRVSTGYISVSAMALTRHEWDAQIRLHPGGAQATLDSGSAAWAFAPLYFPNGATVTRFTCRYRDETSAGRITPVLKRESLATGVGDTLANHNASPEYQASGWTTESEHTIEDATIDNTRYAYFLNVSFMDVNADNGAFGSCVIEYMK